MRAQHISWGQVFTLCSETLQFLSTASTACISAPPPVSHSSNISYLSREKEFIFSLFATLTFSPCNGAVFTLTLLIIYRSLNYFIMTHGDEQPIQTTSSSENVEPSRNGSEPSQTINMDVNSTTQEEKRKREISSELNEKWKSSERESAPASKHHHMLPMNWGNGQELQKKRRGKHLTLTSPKSTPSLLSC